MKTKERGQLTSEFKTWWVILLYPIVLPVSIDMNHIQGWPSLNAAHPKYTSSNFSELLTKSNTKFLDNVKTLTGVIIMAYRKSVHCVQ
jgi:hypothetical protein